MCSDRQFGVRESISAKRDWGLVTEAEQATIQFKNLVGGITEIVNN